MTFDLNFLLRIANLFLCGLSIYLFNIQEDSGLVNIYTIVLVCFFAIENVGMLLYEKKRRNPFIIILIIVVTFFYIGRVATILHLPASASLWDVSYISSATELNYALIFILLANAAMFSGFYLGGKNFLINNNITHADNYTPKIRNAIIILIGVILIDFFNVIHIESFSRLTGYVQSFLNRHTIILFTFTMMAYYYHNITARKLILLIAIILTIVILTTLSGSRAAILDVALLLLMSLLAVKQKVTINYKVIIICLIIIPIAMVFFVTATLKRQLGITDTISVEQFYVAKDYGRFDFDRTEELLGPIYNRLGYLDYSTELIANRQQYTTVINCQYYIKSIIDNVLTPGFDVFNTIKASNALSYVKRGEQIPPDKSLIMEFYQSDQMGIYGEYYVLFYGYPALFVFFFLAYMLQRVLISFRTTNNLRSYLYIAILLNLFFIHMNSFGIDWLAFDIMTTIITTFLFARFYVVSNRNKIINKIEQKQDGGAFACETL